MNDVRHGTGSNPRGAPSRAGRRAALLLLAGAVGFAASVRAVDVDGSARFAWTESDVEAGAVGTTEQNFHLGLTQILTPYLRLRVSDSYADQATTLDGADVFSRTTEQPRVELIYGRPNLSARLAYDLNRTDSSLVADRFRAKAVHGNLSWRSRAGLRVGLSLREATNRGDVAALGRDVDERRARIDLGLERRFWSVGYSAAYGELERLATGLAIEQIRHDVRLSGSRDWLDGRLRIGLTGLAGRLESEESSGAGELAEPLPAVAGLAAIDASPGTGALEAAPGLVDGSVGEITTPAIEVGGANTFRNVGVDLGLSLPATRLEVYVDRPSAPGLVWEVYHSADNLFWEPIPTAISEFDATLLRYTLRFAPVTDRYFKAVNLSVNEAELVRVTEVRALREITEIVGDDRSSDLYRAGLSVGWQVAPRVHLSAGADTTNDETTFGGVTRRDFTTATVRGGVRVDLRPDLRLVLGYRWLDSEDRRSGGLDRTTEEISASLLWNPLATVDAVLVVSNRDELDGDVLLAANSSARLSVDLRLLEELRLVSDLIVARLDSEIAGVERDTVSWSQRFEMEPFERWRLDGGYTWSRTESGLASQPLLERTNLFATVRWSPGSALAWHATLLYYTDDTGGSSLRQSYGLSWSPGPKLNLSMTWNEFEEQRGLLTGGSSLTANYRLARRIQLFGSVSESRTELADGSRERVTTVHAGTAVSF
jgi:hypothetical protein